MNHQGTVRIETDRLILRPFETADASAMFKNWHSDPEVARYLRWPAVRRLEETQAVLEHWTQSYGDPAFYQWAMVLKDREEVIGSLSVVDTDPAVNAVSMGYALGRDWWGQGITTEALQAVIPFFFTEVGVNRLEARHDPKNPASGKVMLKSGLTYEGTLRQADWNNTGIVDVAYYSLLREDWLASQN